jgi:2-dehydropantoate 2-reductase
MPRILVVGAGAVGGYYAALIARRFQDDVLLLARRESFQAIRTSGVTLKGESGEERIPVQVTDDPSTVSNREYVVQTVKMYDLDSSLSQLHEILEAAKATFGLQNGIDKESMIEKHSGQKPLLATTYVSSEKVSPGVISYTPHTPRVYIGESDDEKSTRVLEIQKILNDSGIECLVPQDIKLEVWSKFVYACSILGVCAAARCDLGIATGYEPTRRLLIGAIEEGFRVAAAHGVAIPDKRKTKYLASFARTDDNSRPSMLVDVLRGRKTEVEYINGALARKAAEKGLMAPINDFLYSTISAPKLSA